MLAHKEYLGQAGVVGGRVRWNHVAAFLIVLASTLPGQAASQRHEQYELLKDSAEYEHLQADLHKTFDLARQQTTNADKALFLPNGGVGNAAAALPFYNGSEALLNNCFTKWRQFYRRVPLVFVSLEEIQARNARGRAYIALAQGDVNTHAEYRNQTISISQAALDHIASANWEDPQFSWLRPHAAMLKLQFGKYLSEAHLFLYLHYLSRYPSAARSHLEQARQTAPDDESKARIEALVKP